MKLILTVILSLLILDALVAQEKGSKAQNFTLENLSGEYVDLESMLGEGPIIISFWATWCKPCMSELREYDKIYNEYKDNGLNLVGITIDSERSISKVKPLVKAKNYSFTILYDPNSEVARNFYVNNIPFSLILDKEGTIVYSHLGYQKGDELKIRSIVEELLKDEKI